MKAEPVRPIRPQSVFTLEQRAEGDSTAPLGGSVRKRPRALARPIFRRERGKKVICQVSWQKINRHKKIAQLNFQLGNFYLSIQNKPQKQGVDDANILFFKAPTGRAAAICRS